MAWTFEEKFNTLTDGDLNGQNSWTGDVDFDVQTHISYEGAKGISVTAANGYCTRSITSVSDGVVYFAVMRGNTTGDVSFDFLTGGSTRVRFIVANSNTNVTISNGAGVHTWTGIVSAGNWLLFEFTFDASNNHSVRYHNGVSWSASTGTLSAAVGGNIDGIRLGSGGTAGVSYFDYISPTNPIGSITSVSGSSIDTGLVSYWGMSEASGNRADSKGGNTLTDNNTVASATGIIGNGADFELANSESLSITDAAQTGLDIISDLSFSCWIKIESQPADPDAFSIMYKWDSNQASYGLLYVNESTVKKLRFVGYTTCNGSNISLDKNITAFTPGSWYHVVVTYDASGHPSGTGTVEYYVNGISQGTSSNASLSSLASCTGQFRIGCLGGGIQWFMDGIIDEAAILSRVLRPLEIVSLYNGGTAISYGSSSSGPANLKSYNTNLKANIKSINTNPIANVKSLNTNV